jgi:hypothetical protein
MARLWWKPAAINLNLTPHSTRDKQFETGPSKYSINFGLNNKNSVNSHKKSNTKILRSKIWNVFKSQKIWKNDVIIKT